MRILKTLLLSAIAVSAFFTSNDTFAQPCPDLPPIGSIVTCTFVNGQKVLTVVTPPDNATSSGQGTFRVVGHTYAPCQALLEAIEFFSQGNSPRLGTVNSTLAPNSPLTTLTGQSGSATLFPAQLTINLNVNVNTSALGTLTATSPLKLNAGTITSFRLTNVDATQVGSVELKDANGKVRGSLTNTKVRLNTRDGN